MSLTAATCVLIGLSASFNLAAAMIQIFWMTISVIGIALHLRRKRLHR
jgi:phage shock protein PspC (stress-responsive transcriptional regulator)